MQMQRGKKKMFGICFDFNVKTASIEVMGGFRYLKFIFIKKISGKMRPYGFIAGAQIKIQFFYVFVHINIS